MNRKTWIFVGIAAAVVLAAYVLFRPTARAWTGAGALPTSGTAGTIDATGRAAGGLAKLWTAIFGGSGESGGDSLSTNFSGDYYLDRG